MRRGRRGGHGVLEFGGSGEDSFVAVVVTKLTGALLFILLLVMVIMALLPKAVDPAASADGSAEDDRLPLTIATPARLPEAIAGRPYELALASSGAYGPVRWSIDEPMPDGLAFDPEAGLIRGTPEAGAPGPIDLTVRVSDGRRSDARRVVLVVYRPDGPLTVPSRFEAALAMPRLPWRAWAELGFGFLVLVLVHMVAMNGVAAMEQRARASGDGDGGDAASNPAGRRFVYYRAMLRVTTASAVAALAAWLWLHRDAPASGAVEDVRARVIASASPSDSDRPADVSRD